MSLVTRLSNLMTLREFESREESHDFDALGQWALGPAPTQGGEPPMQLWRLARAHLLPGEDQPATDESDDAEEQVEAEDEEDMDLFGGQVAADPAPADEDVVVKEEDANPEEDPFAGNVEVKEEDANPEEDPFAGNVDVKEDLPTLNNLTHHNRVPLALLSPCHH